MQTIDIHGSDSELQMPQGVLFDATDQAVSGAGAAAVLTLAADANHPIMLGQITVAYSAAPTGGSIKVEDGSGNVVWGPFPITVAGPIQINFVPARCGSRNVAMIITATAGGGAIIATVAANAWIMK